MKILVVSNLYPPNNIGGYEIGCRDVVESLRERGHEIRVLTSRFGDGISDAPAGIYRELHEDYTPRTGRISKLAAPFRTRSNRRCWDRHCKEFDPDAVYLWNLTNIGIWFIEDAIKRGLPTACYVSDQWLERCGKTFPWLSEVRNSKSFANGINILWRRLMDSLLGNHEAWPPRTLPQLHYTSAFIQRGVESVLSSPPGSCVIHWGVSATYTQGQLSVPRLKSDRIQFLYAGQIVEHKGIRTAIEGIAKLKKSSPEFDFIFKIAGGDPSGFGRNMRDLVTSFGLEDTVVFCGMLSREKLRGLYRESDIYIFPSEWQEPFAISLLEAMASACAVVATDTGGSSEILRDGENALVFSAGDFLDLSRCLGKLCVEKEYAARIALCGQKEVCGDYTMSGMVDQIEARLCQMVLSSNRSSAA